jgi:hypothetical protein
MNGSDICRNYNQKWESFISMVPPIFLDSRLFRKMSGCILLCCCTAGSKEKEWLDIFTPQNLSFITKLYRNPIM